MNSPPRSLLPSHAALRTFESAARYESFTLAAKELHLTQSAVSRQVKELEDVIGVALFRRTGRRVALTEAGRQFATELSIDLDNIRRTMMRAISAGNQTHALRVACLPTFAALWLIPRLPQFDKSHPDIQVNISTRLRRFDLSAERFDLAIHFGARDWPDTEMVPLCKETLVPVCSKTFKRKHKIESVEQLIDAPLLHMQTRPLAWQDYFRSINNMEVPALQGKYFDQFTMVISGAVASLGAALLPSYLIEPELDNGALIAVSDHKLLTNRQYYMVTPSDQNNKAVNRLCDWLQANVDH